jgi:hypothetical protein
MDLENKTQLEFEFSGNLIKEVERPKYVGFFKDMILQEGIPFAIGFTYGVLNSCYNITDKACLWVAPYIWH